MDTTLNDAARDVLGGPHFAVIATSNTDGRLQSSVIFVKRDGDTVVFSTIKGRLKTRNMARDPASAAGRRQGEGPLRGDPRDRGNHRGPR
jgi:pyridoxine/pyridoxamine 5'-phosphate oxidase